MLDPAGAPCEISASLRSGVFIRAFECPPFNLLTVPSGAPWITAWNTSHLAATTPEDTFERVFRGCALAQLSMDRHAPASYLRHDLPIKSYADNFGASRAAPRPTAAL